MEEDSLLNGTVKSYVSNGLNFFEFKKFKLLNISNPTMEILSCDESTDMASTWRESSWMLENSKGWSV